VPLLANDEVEQTPEEKAAEEKKAGGKPGMKKLLIHRSMFAFRAPSRQPTWATCSRAVALSMPSKVRALHSLLYLCSIHVLCR
jgi:hypothetical protein